MDGDCFSLSGDPKISEGKVSPDIVSILENVRGGGFSLTGVDVTTSESGVVEPDLIVTFVSVLVDPDFITSLVFPPLSSPEGPERLVSGINQLCPSCLGDLQSLSEKYFPSNDFCEPYFQIFVNIYPRTLITLEPKHHVGRGRG